MSLLNQTAEKAETICILGHINPDGDCAGSALAVFHYLKRKTPEKCIQIYLQEANEKLHNLPGYETICNVVDDRRYDLAVIVDCADQDRLGEFACYAETAKNCVVFDHHVTNTGFAKEGVIRPDASSTCEVLFDEMDREDISKETATCIYTGIIHDTGVFKFNSTSPHTMEIAGFCMELGIDFGSIIDDSFYSKSYIQQQVMGRALMESILVMDGRCVVASLRLSEMKFYGITSKDMDGIVAELRQTRGVDCAVFAYELQPQTFKVSLRSNNQMLDVSKVAAYFGGGGHVMAAGCSVHGNLYDVINNVTKQLSVQMDAPGFISVQEKKEL